MRKIYFLLSSVLFAYNVQGQLLAFDLANANTGVSWPSQSNAEGYSHRILMLVLVCIQFVILGTVRLKSLELSSAKICQTM